MKTPRVNAGGDNDYECLPQYLSAIAVSLGACVVGTWMTFTSVAIPKMMETTANTSHGTAANLTVAEAGLNTTGTGAMEDPITISLHEGAWIASLFFVGNIVGCLAGGLGNQKLGSRKVFLLSAPAAALTWVIIALSRQLWHILVSRVISGVIFGLFQANGKVYNAEIAHPDLRGSLGTIIGNMFALGSMYTYLLGYFIHSWRTIAWLQLVPTCLMGISVFFVPDSPYWLVEKGRYEDAKESLVILRGSNYDVSDEYQVVLQKVPSEANPKVRNHGEGPY